MTPRILLTGKNGQVGFELRRALAPLGEVVACDRERCDLANPASIREAIAVVKPAIVVNPAAYTAVDRAEGDEATARTVNGVAPGVIGEEAKKLGALVVHYSTDYVYDGAKTGAYVESDAPNPRSVYGRTKLAGEEALRASGADALIFRTSWVFGVHGHNFVKTILRLARDREELKIVADQFGAPTAASLIADVTAQVLGGAIRGKSAPTGVYHLAAAGKTSWHAYAVEIVRLAAAAGFPLRCGGDSIQAIPTEAYPLPAPRPANSELSTARLREAFGLTLPDWSAPLAHAMGPIVAMAR